MAEQDKLTSRQKTFLSRLMDVYRDIQKPVHYSVIAQRIGLCSSSAYDMLRVLEQKGMVISLYRTPKAATGPGRSNIMFLPTAKTIKQFDIPAMGMQEHREWGETKKVIMTGLDPAKSSDYRKFAISLFERAVHVQSPLATCAQIMTGLLLSLKMSKHVPVDRNNIGALLEAPATNLGMSSIAGLVLGLSLTDEKVRKQLQNYQEYIHKYIVSLQDMSSENLVVLRDFSIDVWARLQGSPLYQH